MILKLEILSASSVNVSWESFDSSLINSYIVYYSRIGNVEEVKSFNVSGLLNSVIISGLMTEVQYQFQVVAVNRNNVPGERSDEIIMFVTPTTAPTTNNREFGLPCTLANVYSNYSFCNVATETFDVGPIAGGLAAFIIAVIIFVVILIIIVYLR